MEEVEEPKPLAKEEIKVPIKEKKPRSEKQIEAFKKASAIRDANRQKRKEETKKILEEKILQKAVSIKKKQIKKMQVLNEISDDETPMEEIRQIQRAITPPPLRPIQQIQQPIKIVPPKPQFYFM